MNKHRAVWLLSLMISTRAFAADHKIEQKDRRFSQSQIEIHVGDQLTFTNSDEVTHNVYSSTPGLEFEIKRQAPGGSSTVPFNKEGVVEVRCSIHPSMKLTVKVQK